MSIEHLNIIYSRRLCSWLKLAKLQFKWLLGLRTKLSLLFLTFRLDRQRGGNNRFQRVIVAHQLNITLEVRFWIIIILRINRDHELEGSVACLVYQAKYTVCIFKRGWSTKSILYQRPGIGIPGRPGLPGSPGSPGSPPSPGFPCSAGIPFRLILN